MLIKRFQVRGYKNFQQPIVLDEMERLNVIHGPNNVGKSNLLQAIALFFYLLTPKAGESKPLPIAFGETLSSEELTAMGFAPRRIFNLESPQPIEMSATFAIEQGELQELGIQELIPSQTVEIAIRLSRILDRLEVRITRLRFANGRDLTQRTSPSPEEHTYALRFALFLTRNFLVQTRHAGDRFALIGLDRRLAPGGQPSKDEEAHAAVVPAPLMLELYDAKESLEPEIYQRWELFTQVMEKFSDVLGEGRFLATFDRTIGRANLVFETRGARIPVDLLGAGIQQVVSIVARLLMTRATVIGIEEPESNLRFDMQLRLREILEEVVSSASQGPRQVLLTSHSPAFEHGEWFYAMQPTASGPMVERRRGAEAARFTRHALGEEPPPQGAATVGYVSSDGLVRIPESVRRELGLEHGGGIVIWKREGAPYYELLTDEQFLDDMRGPSDAGNE